MCIRDSPRTKGGKTETDLFDRGKIKETYGLEPVSYTHLDVYKRQDLYITVKIKRHSIYTRSGNNVICDIPISITQATLGRCV